MSESNITRLRSLGEARGNYTFFAVGDQVILNHFGIAELPMNYQGYPKDIYTVIDSDYFIKRATIQSNSEPEFKIRVGFNYLCNARGPTDRTVYVVAIQAHAHPQDPSTAKYHYLATTEETPVLVDDLFADNVLLFPTNSAASKYIARLFGNLTSWPKYLDKVIVLPQLTDCLEVVEIRLTHTVKTKIRMVDLFKHDVPGVECVKN